MPDLPEITYITGMSITTTGVDGDQHTIVIQVNDPHTLDSACPVGVAPCLAEGALSVEVDGEEALLAPGVVWLAPDVAVSAVNLPGACRYALITVETRLVVVDRAENASVRNESDLVALDLLLE